ncbi:hypothetical protein [Absidia glauca]|uniref:Uncharacterized protein n=1 Tax=Absidia glauca TaxID=4829 RepID=A0A168QC26_ABSGL|nr:hypothetical protein [Absidia glauca]
MEDAVSQARNAGGLLEDMLILIEPTKLDENEIDTYQECLQLKEHLSDQLWSVTESKGVMDVQNALDGLTRAITGYEMMKDAAEGDWELVDVSIPSL